MTMNARGLKARLGELCTAAEEMRDRAQERLDNAQGEAAEEKAQERLDLLESILASLEDAQANAEEL